MEGTRGRGRPERRWTEEVKELVEWKSLSSRKVRGELGIGEGGRGFLYDLIWMIKCDERTICSAHFLGCLVVNAKEQRGVEISNMNFLMRVIEVHMMKFRIWKYKTSVVTRNVCGKKWTKIF